MRRRGFIAGLAAFGAAVASPVLWPYAALAQQRPVVGYLSPGQGELEDPILKAFRDGLKQTGLVEGGNLTIEYRWANGDNARLPDLAADLVRRKVVVIVTSGLPATRAAKAATDTIPIVFGTGVDPVALGLVASLARPGGNLTGVSVLDDGRYTWEGGLGTAWSNVGDLTVVVLTQRAADETGMPAVCDEVLAAARAGG